MRGLERPLSLTKVDAVLMKRRPEATHVGHYLPASNINTAM